MTTDVSIGGTDFKLFVSADADGRPVDVHIAHSKHGSFGHGMLEAFGELLTEALHYGMPLEEVVARFVNTRFEPQGWRRQRHPIRDQPDRLPGEVPCPGVPAPPPVRGARRAHHRRGS